MGKWNRPSLLGAGLFCVATGLALSRRGTTVGTMLMAVAVVIALGMLIAFVLHRRLCRAVENARERRPDAVVIPAYTTGEMVELGHSVGASVQGWMSQGGNPIAIAVRAERIEVWSGREPEPRWSVARADIEEIDLFTSVYGARGVDVLGVRAAAGGLLFVPAYRPLRNMGGSDPSGLQRALQDLGGPVRVG